MSQRGDKAGGPRRCDLIYLHKPGCRAGPPEDGRTSGVEIAPGRAGASLKAIQANTQDPGSEPSLERRWEDAR